MRVRMAIGISGGRADDRPWPAVGHEIDVPDHEGEDLIRARHAVYVGPSEPEAFTPAEPVFSQPSETGAGPVEEPASQSGPPDAVEAVPEPKPSDPKQAWVDYAMGQGATEDEANSMTKADLMSRYGGRL